MAVRNLSAAFAKYGTARKTSVSARSFLTKLSGLIDMKVLNELRFFRLESQLSPVVQS
jgi:hypothetical protein